MKRTAIAIALVFFGVSAFATADLTGKWTGSFKPTINGEQRNDDFIYLDLKQTGNDLTGVAGPTADNNWPILKGKVDGAKVTFQVQMLQNGQEGPLMSMALELVNDHLKGTANAEFQGNKMSAVIDAERKK